MALGQGRELRMRVLVIKDDEVTVTAIVTGHRQATDPGHIKHCRSIIG
jgi:hypothetical protein